MALKRLKLKLAQPTPDQTGSEIPVIAIEGDLIKQYNEASDQVKRGEELMEDLRPDVQKIGLNQIFGRSCKRPATPTTSVKFQDDEGEVLMFTFVNRYKEVADVDAAEQLFEDNAIDIDQYVTEGIKSKFDDSAFYDADGNFLQEVYDDVRKAIQTIVTKHQMTKNPLETVKVVKIKPAFHVERFQIMPKVETQLRAFEVLPNTVMLKPIRAKLSNAKK